MDFIKLFNSRGYFITPYVDEFDGLERTFTWRLSAKQRAILRYKMNGATKGFYPLVETDEDAAWLRDVAEHIDDALRAYDAGIDIHELLKREGRLAKPIHYIPREPKKPTRGRA
ncbi:hypothetical protein [Bifidobacterium dentium]|uniref:hypothetical protein n=1 Tax=Bifidobacterium dentium TaxID=1689 RepID=UPI0018B0D9DB|nr:hypothetical protein [Bifidobacterium dentium]MBF9688062.1 hypothetical protein [Bifidobacterium dentium]